MNTYKTTLPSNKPWGIVMEMSQGALQVVEVDRTSLAWNNGIRTNDVIMSINSTNTSNSGHTMEGVMQMVQELKKKTQSIEITLARQAPTAQVTVAPEQNAWKLDMEESILYNGEPFVYNPPNCSETCYMLCCIHKKWAKYTAKGNREIVYYNNCMVGPPCCKDHWRVKYIENGNTTKLGYTTGMTGGQGLKSFCCPCGDRVIQNFNDGKGKRVFTIRKKITCTNCCCTKIASLGKACAFCVDGFSWLSNQNYILLKEKIMDASGRNVVGEIDQVIRVDCIQCIPVRTPIRYSVKMKQAGNHAPALVSLLPMFYRGVPAPCTM
jgi:hypothetical protein